MRHSEFESCATSVCLNAYVPQSCSLFERRKGVYFGHDFDIIQDGSGMICVFVCCFVLQL